MMAMRERLNGLTAGRDPKTISLIEVSDMIDRANGTIAAARYLKKDLAARGSQELKDTLLAAENIPNRTIKRVSHQFLLLDMDRWREFADHFEVTAGIHDDVGKLLGLMTEPRNPAPATDKMQSHDIQCPKQNPWKTPSFCFETSDNPKYYTRVCCSYYDDGALYKRNPSITYRDPKLRKLHGIYPITHGLYLKFLPQAPHYLGEMSEYKVGLLHGISSSWSMKSGTYIGYTGLPPVKYHKRYEARYINGKLISSTRWHYNGVIAATKTLKKSNSDDSYTNYIEHSYDIEGKEW